METRKTNPHACKVIFDFSHGDNSGAVWQVLKEGTPFDSLECLLSWQSHLGEWSGSDAGELDEDEYKSRVENGEIRAIFCGEVFADELPRLDMSEIHDALYYGDGDEDGVYKIGSTYFTTH